MTDRCLILHPVFPLLWSVALIAATGVLCLWWEWKKEQKSREGRIIAGCLLILALAGLMLRPAYPITKSTDILLLTPGYETEQADSLVNANPALTVLHLSGAAQYGKSTPVTSDHALASLGANVRYVLGNGLPVHTQDYFSGYDFQFFASELPAGIVQLTIPDKNAVNQPNEISGIVHATDSSLILLRGPSGNEDSLRINKQGLQPFTLSFTPKSTGNFVYQIVVRNAANERTINDLPVSVTGETGLTILFLQAQPTFEVQYLKRYLAPTNRLVLRSQLSRNKYHFEFVNHLPLSFGRINEKILQDFDLVLIDADALSGLSISETAALDRAIRDGLGMVVLMNERPETNEAIQRALATAFRNSPRDTVHLHFGSSHAVLPAIPRQITSAEKFIPVTSAGRRVLSAYVYKGFGKVAYQLLQNTWSLTLKGDTVSYAAIWAPLIERTARSKKKKASITLGSKFPFFEDDPVSFRVTGTEPSIRANGSPVPLQEDLILDDVWHGKIWAGQPGWHALTDARDSAQLHYYVSKENEWKTLRASNNYLQTSVKSGVADAKGTAETVYEMVPQLLFFAIFLIAAGSLWLLPRL